MGISGVTLHGHVHESVMMGLDGIAPRTTGVDERGGSVGRGRALMGDRQDRARAEERCQALPPAVYVDAILCYDVCHAGSDLFLRE